MDGDEVVVVAGVDVVLRLSIEVGTVVVDTAAKREDDDDDDEILEKKVSNVVVLVVDNIDQRRLLVVVTDHPKDVTALSAISSKESIKAFVGG
jgi:hypothetical protein